MKDDDEVGDEGCGEVYVEGCGEGCCKGGDEGCCEGSDEGVVKVILSCLRGCFLTDRQTDGWTNGQL